MRLADARVTTAKQLCLDQAFDDKHVDWLIGVVLIGSCQANGLAAFLDFVEDASNEQTDVYILRAAGVDRSRRC